LWSGGIAPPLMTLTPDRVERSVSLPGLFTPGKSHRYLLDMRLAGRTCLDYAKQRKVFASAGNGTVAVQPVAHRCTD
jgi:hypothetical protein